MYFLTDTNVRQSFSLRSFEGEIVSTQLKQLSSPLIYFIVFIQIATVFLKKIIFEVSRHGELLETQWFKPKDHIQAARSVEALTILWL